MSQILMVLMIVRASRSRRRRRSDTGRVVGTVADSTGAFIPGATVKLTNTDTGVVQTRTTGSCG